jgi:tetratricopeptide (TPR) repeat protein
MSPKRKRRGACTATAFLALAAAVATVTAPMPPAWGQQEEDLTAGLRGLREAYDRARERIEELDFAAAVSELQAVIEPRRAARPADLGAEEQKLLCAAYDLRARAQFNLGNSGAAESDFEALLRLDPTWAIDRQTLSPKVVDLFDKVRRRMVAVLALVVEPPRARVTIDGEPVDPSSPDGIGLLAGSRTLAVAMEGYDPHSEILSAAGGARLERTIRLAPNRRTVEFITVPSGVRVTLDGAPAGLTAGPATPEVEALAVNFGFDPARASAPLAVPLVTPGEHRVTFERDCHRSQTLTVKVDLDPAGNRPLRFSPVVLEESMGRLQIDSVPSGADVLVDGVRQGATPLTIGGLCGGERDITVVKADVGRWSERIRLTPGELNTLAVRLRPTLLYAGTFRLDEWGRAVWSDEDRPLIDALGRGLRTLNVVRMPQAQEALRDAIVRWMIADPREARAGTLVPPDLLKDAAEKTGADLVLAGLTYASDPEGAWTLALYSVLHPAPDRVRLKLGRDDEVRDFVARLDSAPSERATFWGLGLADTALPPGGPVVARVLPGSPAARAGLARGERIVSVGEERAAGARQAMAGLAAAADRGAGVRAPVVLSVLGKQGTRTVRIAPGEAPALLALTDPGRLYNRALAEYRLRSKAAVDDAARGVAQLNLGLAYMHFRAWDRAVSEGLGRADLPEGSGIGRGTVLYYRGLCALRRGDPEAAKQAFTAASRSAGSTLESADGPSASAAAMRALQAAQ